MSDDLPEMSHWNYRIIKSIDVFGTWYSLHEVFYDDNHKPILCTQEPVRVGVSLDETPDDLIHVLEMMLNDAKKCKDDILDMKYFDDLGKTNEL